MLDFPAIFVRIETMGLRLHNVSVTPPGEFRFFVDELHRWLPEKGSFSNYPQLRSAALACFKANGIPATHIDERLQDQVCKALGPDHCYSTENKLWRRVTTDYTQFVEGTATLGRLLLAKTLGRNAFVDQPVAEKRAAICVLCEFNRPPGDCPTCGANTLQAAIGRVTGDRKTSFDVRLGGCGMCGCGLKAKVHVSQEVLRGASSDIPYPAHCWMKKEKS